MTTAEIPFELAKKIKFTKKAEKTENAGLFGVFDYDDSLSFEITAPRELGLFGPKIVFYRDDDSRELSFDLTTAANYRLILRKLSTKIRFSRTAASTPTTIPAKNSSAESK